VKQNHCRVEKMYAADLSGGKILVGRPTYAYL
jgi:hypothetical protein